jgi:signal transduction histidine kinase
MFTNSKIYIALSAIFISSLLTVSLYAQKNSFKDVSLNGEGTLDIHWHESRPFIYTNEQGNLTGIEFELISAFKDYLYSRYNLDLKLNWIADPTFYDVFDNIKSSEYPNNFGASAFSITNARDSLLDFTNPYFPDITVLISNSTDIKTNDADEFIKMAANMTAVTIRGTTYENMLLDLEKKYNVKLTINYIPSYANIIKNILMENGQFGFIDLPIYLLYLKDGANLQRHDMFSATGKGYAIILPENSDWKLPFDQYLTDPITKAKITRILNKYLGDDINSFIDEIKYSPKIEESILAKEKQLVQQSLDDVTSVLEREKQIRFFLNLTISFIVLLLLIVLFLFFYVSRKNKNLQLSETKLLRERDKHSLNNQRLMNRNVQLNTMSEERNTLFHMLVHDLRTPINNIQGLIELLQNVENPMKEEDKVSLLQKMHDSCIRMNRLIDQIFASEKGGLQKSSSLTEELDLIELFSKTTENFINHANRKNIKIVVKKSHKSCLIQSDYLQLTQIFENLVSNAIKFSPKSSEIICSIDCTSTDAVVRISDNGPGFNENDKLNLFKVFQPLTAKPTDGEKSTGLGLAIVKRCCDSIGATLKLDDTYKNGASFIISIPIKK